MKIYSPSQTSSWLRCPILRKLQVEGWRSKYLQKKDIAGAMGTAFSAGVGAWNNMRLESERGARAIHDALVALSHQERGAAAMGVGASVFKQQIEDFTNAGFDFSNVDESYLESCPIEISRAIAKYCANDPIPSNYSIVAVEESLPNHGNCRPDLVIRTPRGLAVLDYKSKYELKAQYRAKTINEYKHTQQGFHYTWGIEETYGEPCNEFLIALCVFRPNFNVELFNHTLAPETRLVWKRGMESVWARMESEELDGATPWMSDRHSDNFGQCEMYDACFTHHYDPQLMKSKYINTLEEK